MRVLQCIALAFWLAFGTAFAALAQEVPGLDFATWENLATRAEAAMDDPARTEESLEELRSRVAGYRAQFDTARAANSERILSLREQIAALAQNEKDSEAGEPEPADVIAKRSELEGQLQALLAPVQVAESAFRRADGLVGEIDAILRTRQTNELLSQTVSPLNPALWPDAIEKLVAAVRALRDEAGGVNTTVSGSDLRTKLPLVVGLGLLGLLLIARGQVWANAIVGTLRKRGTRGMEIWRFVVSLLRIILPLIGLTALGIALSQTGFFGPKTNALLLTIPVIGAFILGFRWVSERIFSPDDDEALIALPQDERRRARLLIYLITYCFVADILIQFLLKETLQPPADNALTVLSFPITVLIAWFLYRLCGLLRGYGRARGDLEATDEETPPVSTLARTIRGFGRAGPIVAAVSVLLHATGYQNAANSLLQPFFITLIMLGLVMVLQRFLADVYGVVTGKGVKAREALMPVLFGMVLFLLALPVLALNWGARLTDLTETWGLFTRGFSIGDSRISPTDFIAFAVIFAIGYVLTRLVQGALRNNVLPKTKIDVGGQNALVSGLGYVGIFLAALAAINGAGIDLSSLAIVAGALSVGLGFGLQNIVSNFVSGIILLIERPISEGDWIEVGGQMGYVRDISVRSTRIETFDRTDVIVPNADLISGTVTNYTRGNTVGRVIVQIGVAYGSDTRQVEKILREIAEAQPMVLANPPPNVVFVAIGASTYDFEVRAILRDVNWMLTVKNDINHEVVRRFAEANIEMAFPQQDIWLRNPEAIKAAFSK